MKDLAFLTAFSGKQPVVSRVRPLQEEVHGDYIKGEFVMLDGEDNITKSLPQWFHLERLVPWRENPKDLKLVDLYPEFKQDEWL